MAITVYTPDEIAKLREGGRRLARAVDEVARATVPGVSTAILNDIVVRLIRKDGDTPSFEGYTPRGAKRPFPAALCVSVNEEVVHGIANEDPRTIQEGDIVGLDCGVTHGGLVTDHAVTVIAGTGDAKAKKLVRMTEEALMVGIHAARAGGHVGDIGAAVQAVGEREGYGIVYELGGHGVGHTVHEEPYISNLGVQGEGPELVAGMVIAIEPMFTEGADKVKLMPDGYTYVTQDGSRSAHFEHTILITNGAPEVLTSV
jgi:methionyl aminopeptidase